MKRYYDGFDDYQSMAKEFTDSGWDYDTGEMKVSALPARFPSDADVLFAAYGQEEAYCGEATVIFRADDGLRIVEGSHCSCRGLEGQWEPSITTLAALKVIRLGSAYTAEALSGFQEMLTELEAKT